jgi:hypothetical protein
MGKNKTQLMEAYASGNPSALATARRTCLNAGWTDATIDACLQRQAAAVQAPKAKAAPKAAKAQAKAAPKAAKPDTKSELVTAILGELARVLGIPQLAQITVPAAPVIPAAQAKTATPKGLASLQQSAPVAALEAGSLLWVVLLAADGKQPIVACQLQVMGERTGPEGGRYVRVRLIDGADELAFEIGRAQYDRLCAGTAIRVYPQINGQAHTYQLKLS